MDYILWHRTYPDLKLTANFRRSEFACPCGHCYEQRISKKLVKRLQDIRTQLDLPIIVTSGYRCKDYQRSLENRGYATASNLSAHLFGDAADVKLGGSADRRLHMKFIAKCLDKFDAVGIGYTWCHVDTRSGKGRLWFYNN